MRSVLVCLAPLVLASLAATAPVQGGGWHQDPRFGFKFLPPKGWTRIPLKVDENWLVAKYLSDKTYIWNDKEIGWSNEHKPELMVIAFVEEAIKKAKEKQDEPIDGRQGGRPALSRTPQGLRGLPRSHVPGGGFTFPRGRKASRTDVPTKYEIKVEKLVRDGPKRLMTWIYHLQASTSPCRRRSSRTSTTS